MTVRVVGVLVLLGVVAISGCSLIQVGHTPLEVRPCSDVYTESRCAAIDDRVATRPEIAPQAVVDVLIVPFDPVGKDGVVKSLGGAPPLEVRVVMADGSSRDIILGCGGVGNEHDPVCTDDPVLQAASVTMGGYRDVPCMTEDLASCATRHPSIVPDVEVLSQPISFERVDIPIIAVGHVEFPIGTGSLPNGILNEASFAFVDDWPDDVTFTDGTILLDVRSLEPDGLPFDNYYNHGWRAGLERIEAVLVFHVRSFEPGATLQVRDVLVR